MRTTLAGAITLIGVGILLAIVAVVWHRAYNTEYSLTVEEALAGEPSGWLTSGPRNKTVTVTGLALRSKAERITVRGRGGRERTTGERMYFPLRMADDNRAFLVGVPYEMFDTRVLLFETADQRLAFTGVIDLTPRTRDGRRIEHLFEGVTLPSRYCLSVGEEGGWKEPKWLAVSGVALVLAGGVLLVLRRPGSAAAAADEPGERGTEHEPSRPPPPLPALSPGRPGEALSQPGLDQSAAADAMAAMSAVVAGQPPAGRDPGQAGERDPRPASDMPTADHPPGGAPDDVPEPRKDCQPDDRSAL